MNETTPALRLLKFPPQDPRNDQIHQIVRKLGVLKACSPGHLCAVEMLINLMLERFGFSPGEKAGGR